MRSDALAWAADRFARCTLLFGLMVVALVLAGCGQSSESSGSTTPGKTAPSRDGREGKPAGESDSGPEARRHEPAPPASEPRTPDVRPEPPAVEEGEPAPEPEPPTPDPQPPNLYELALDLDELPVGTGIDSERLVRSLGALSGFRRNFAVQGRKLGSSEPVELQTDLLVYPDDAAAAAVMQAIRQRLSGDGAADGFQEALMDILGLDVEAVVMTTGSLSDLGDETLAAQASFDTPAGRADGLLVTSHVSIFINFILIITPRGLLDGSDLGPLVTGAISRLEAEVERLRDEGELPEREGLPRPDEGTA